MKYAIAGLLKLKSISKQLSVVAATFRFDAGLIFEKLQHYFRKFSKTKTISVKQSNGWLSDDDQIHHHEFSNWFSNRCLPKQSSLGQNVNRYI
jgi:hypothetical protein